jgi:two-component system, LytTR family, sensor kinase
MTPRTRQILFQLLGSIGFSIVFGGVFFLIQSLSNPTFLGEAWKKAGIVLITYAVCFSLVGLLLGALFFKKLPTTHLSFLTVLQGILFLFGIGLIGALLSGYLLRWILPEENLLAPRALLSTVFYVVFLGSPLFLALLVRELWREALKKVREKEVAQERLEKELLAAQLRNLQSQVNPHFLFNSLNSIAALISSNPSQAERTVEQLANLFRYALDCNHGDSIQLEEEVKIIEDYLAIEKVRFGERLNYRITIDPQLRDWEIPPLLLQPLVENAIKHGISRREENSQVSVQARLLDGKVELLVENDGPPPPLLPAGVGVGVGLKNLKSRCQLVYGGEFRFDLEQVTPGRTRARLWLPATRLAPKHDPGGVHES